jgi:hypothetical protein
MTRANNKTLTGTAKMTNAAKKKTIWIVWMGEVEIGRHTTERMARVIASEIGGWVSKYTTEG